MVKAIPEGYTTVTPYLVVEDAAKLLEFAEKGLGATELMRMPGPGGSVSHAEFKIGDSIVMTGTAGPENPPMPGMIYLYVEDTDALYNKAVAAGATSLEEPADQFYGDRRAAVKDSQGNQWFIATHIEDPTPEQMEERMKEMMQAQG